jgi:hypothetical protein
MVMKQATRAKPEMWGPSIVGFGSYRYPYGSGREGEWFLTGFSPRKQNLTLYIMPGFDRYRSLMDRLGRHTTGKSCLYVKRLSDLDLDVLKELVAALTAGFGRQELAGRLHRPASFPCGGGRLQRSSLRCCFPARSPRRRRNGRERPLTGSRVSGSPWSA